MGIMDKPSVKDLLKDIDEPVTIFESWSFLKGQKLRVMIIYEDRSFKIYSIPLKDNYLITVNKKKYILLPECILHSRKRLIMYYFNNPMPINPKWQKSKMTTLMLMSKDRQARLKDHVEDNLAETIIDAQALQSAFSSNLINKMYSEGGLSTKMIIVIIVVIAIVILIILQLTGTIDIIGAISSTAGGTPK